MKRLMFLMVTVLLSGSGLRAQTWGEWFNQNSTQKKYLKQQIIALQVYINYARQGYKIAKDGLNTIGDLSKGEFNLHQDYFTSLKVVNPRIRNYQKVTGIIELQLRIVNGYQQVRTSIYQTDVFLPVERQYVTETYSRLISECENTLVELIAVVSDFRLEMTDEQRINRIDQLFTHMQSHYGFYKSFTSENKVLLLARSKQSKDVQNSRALHGINQ
ncbi:hypothetical protein [Flavobacterium cerinum]|uniref:TerB family tellurite resistance protein n=1 Tax=Flavobacterium cerinum TaxID=2502784 RepID=A0ABY5IPJ2_9FLAO|nr:hypothetical protein [Flavobacterium cerinum]UUC44201.1 hypothetical protein NOX80_11210 [Flavobacterium cerinum]